MKSSDLRLYAVTDRRWLRGRSLEEVVRESLEGGVTFVQLREKNLCETAFLEEARQLQDLCRAYHVPFVVNDRVGIAAAVQADGVHVGQNDMSVAAVRRVLGDGAIVGVSVQTVEQAVTAERDGADYLGVGAVFATDSKKDAEIVSIDTLGAICRAVSIPVVAIGGITAGNAEQLKNSGICGVAVISAVYAESDICGAAKRLKKTVATMLQSGRKEGGNDENCVNHCRQ